MMKTERAFIFIFLVSIIALGCLKRQEAPGISGLGIDEDKDVVTQTITSFEVVEPLTQPAAPIAQPGEPIQVDAAPLEGMERNKQIQLALKNANLYFGEIDGKIGPLSRKAIEEFQKMKGLKVDGKVGPITWGELQKYLNIQPSSGKTKNKK